MEKHPQLKRGSDVSSHMQGAVYFHFVAFRVVGYLAHWRESLVDPDTKIMRPQQDYRGVWLRHYQGLDQRPEAPRTGTDCTAAQV